MNPKTQMQTQLQSPDPVNDVRPSQLLLQLGSQRPASGVACPAPSSCSRTEARSLPFSDQVERQSSPPIAGISTPLGQGAARVQTAPLRRRQALHHTCVESGGWGKGDRHLLGSQSGDFVLGLTPTGHRAASKRECGKRWGIDAIRAENPRGAPTCARLPTAGPKPPAHDPLPAPRHPSPRTHMPLRTYAHSSTRGTMGAMGLVWATDWRLILDWVPYVNSKFKRDPSLSQILSAARQPKDSKGQKETEFDKFGVGV
ncbi:UQCR11 [Cervus elaphus hippelaphus]|uniref:UQCR11 n=1 Tax=Cervus elaphus hippelaphus TaxID=46360 RepID=A0A212D2B5_CEREH|nr:UQCR11 [Cervus elaphus hippelaphus]